MQTSIFHGTLPEILDVAQPIYGDNGSLDTATLRVLTAWSSRQQDLQTLGLGRGLKIPSTILGINMHAMFARDLRITARTDATCTWEIPIAGLFEDVTKLTASIANTAEFRDTGTEERLPPALRDMNGELIYVNMNGWKVDRNGNIVNRDSYSRVFSGEGDINDAQPGRAVIPRVSVNTKYFTTSMPETNVAGKPYTPTIEVSTLPEVISATSERARFQFPFGWVMDSREVEILFTEEPAAGSGPRYVAPPFNTETTVSRGLFAVTDRVTYYVANLAD